MPEPEFEDAAGASEAAKEAAAEHGKPNLDPPVEPLPSVRFADNLLPPPTTPEPLP